MEAAIIDPSPESFKKVALLIEEKNFKPTQILLTHSHWDHIADVSLFKKKFAIPVLVHSLDSPNLEHPGSDGLPMWVEIPAVKPDQLFSEGDQLKIGLLIFSIIHTPGHSPGSVCFYQQENGKLFSGDTLFKGAIGNLSFPTSQPELMETSLAKLAMLPSETEVFPGHGPATTIHNEFIKE